MISSISSPRETSASGFAAFLSLWLLVVPLFFAGMVLGADRNIHQYLDRLERDAQFVVLLKADIRADEATRLAEEWQKSGNWQEARANSALENLSKTDELNRWLGDNRNKEIIEPLPYSIELRPTDIFNPILTPDKISQDLKTAPETEDVFYDVDGVNWMRSVHSGWNGLRIFLYAAASLMALVGAALAGYVNERLLGDKEQDTFAGNTKSALLACSSGAIAAVVLAVLYGLLSFSMRLPLTFLSIPAVAGVVVAGVVLGFLVSAARIWVHSKLGRILLPVLIISMLLALHSQIQAESPTNNQASALPNQGEAPDPNLSAQNPAGREAIEQDITRQIAEKERIIEYLNDWLLRSDEERKLDQQNRHLHQIRAELATEAFRYSEAASARHHEEASRFCAALLQTGGRLTKSPSGIRSRTQKALVSRLLLNSADQSLFLLDIDRREIKKQMAAAEELSFEQKKLEIFSKMANKSPQAVEAEKQRIEAERLALLQKRTLLQTSPPAQVQTKAPQAVASVAIPEPEVGVREVRRPGQVFSNRISSRNDSVYYLSVPAGTLIHAAYGGKVLFAGKFTGLGQAVIIEHEAGLSTLYGFLSEIVVKPGQVIQTGDYIGSAGIVRPQGYNGIRFEAREDGQLTRLSRIPGISTANIGNLLKGEGR